MRAAKIQGLVNTTFPNDSRLKSNGMPCVIHSWSLINMLGPLDMLEEGQDCMDVMAMGSDSYQVWYQPHLYIHYQQLGLLSPLAHHLVPKELASCIWLSEACDHLHDEGAKPCIRPSKPSVNIKTSCLRC